MEIENVIILVLQTLTIIVTIVFGIVSFIQTKKLRKSQNVVSITTNYRLQRSEQLKECVKTILAYSSDILLDCDDINKKIVKCKISEAVSQMCVIMHRSYDQDRELINIGNSIYMCTQHYLDGGMADKEFTDNKSELNYNRSLLIIKCDWYTAADWLRIKKETAGTETKSDEWIVYYNVLEEKYQPMVDNLNIQYNKNK